MLFSGFSLSENRQQGASDARLRHTGPSGHLHATPSYIPALLPVDIRATASGFCINICRFFTATAVFCVGAMVAMLGGFSRALPTFALSFVVALWVAFYSPETETDLS